MFEPVPRQALSDAVFAQLRRRIVEGDLTPGELLPSERELCRLLGVNRGALREALKRLEESRLVEIQHGGGTRVLDYRRHGSMSLLEALLFAPDGALRFRIARGLLEMRSALAPDVARLAALRRSDADLVRLDHLLDRMKAHRDDIRELQLDVLALWDALVDGSDNLAYRLAFNTLRDGYASFLELLSEAVREEVSDWSGYRALVAAVRRQQAGRAERQARALMDTSGKRIATLLVEWGEP
jgi:GntR family transcriptional repressor for pyruvate dehydrogenase complex